MSGRWRTQAWEKCDEWIAHASWHEMTIWRSVNLSVCVCVYVCVEMAIIIRKEGIYSLIVNRKRVYPSIGGENGLCTPSGALQGGRGRNTQFQTDGYFLTDIGFWKTIFTGIFIDLNFVIFLHWLPCVNLKCYWHKKRNYTGETFYLMFTHDI